MYLRHRTKTSKAGAESGTQVRGCWREGRAESHGPWGLLALILSVIDRKFTAHSEKFWVVGIVARQVQELFQLEVQGCIPIRWPLEGKKELQCITPSSDRPRNWPTRFSCVHLRSFTPNGPFSSLVRHWKHDRADAWDKGLVAVILEIFIPLFFPSWKLVKMTTKGLKSYVRAWRGNDKVVG